MLRTRLASAAVLIPLVCAAAYLGGLVLTIFVALVALLAAHEYFVAIRSNSCSPQGPARPTTILGMTLTLGFVLDAQWPQLDFLSWGLAMTALLPLVAQVFAANRPGALNGWALTTAGSLYVGYSLSHAIRLRALDQGLGWIAIALIGTWMNDTGAYLIGSHFGRRPFFPEISPNKTTEGAIGGAIVGVATVLGLVYLFGLPLSLRSALLLGLLLALAAAFGDLAESVIKRQLGIKDTSQIIPGHGGMLDRVDSLLLVMPTIYYAALILAAV